MSKKHFTNKTKKKRSGVMAITTVAVIIVVILCSLFAWYLMNNLEKGILDVCATQQDAYVQLVLDQINLKENRNDEEIINDILSTLDSSSNKYWTFSKERSMLFVKDVTETNRYKGLTTGTYYDSETGQDFLESLQLDRVIHRHIIVNEKEYLASGVAFRYGSEDYRLCLLTNKSVILSNNRFMNAKLEMLILVGFMMIALMSVSILFAGKLDKLVRRVKNNNESIIKLQGTVGQLNEIINKKDHYDTRYQLWGRETIRDFLKKINARNINKVFAARIEFDGAEGKTEFLENACVFLDKKVLRFMLNDNEVLLIFIQYDEQQAADSLEPLLSPNAKSKGVKLIILNNKDIDKYVTDLDNEVKNGYKNL